GLYNKIPTTDVRRLMWCDDVNDVENFPGIVDGNRLTPIPNQIRVRLMHNKFRVANPVSRGGDIPLMRAAEMYLIAAEAYSRMGTEVDKARNTLAILAKHRDPEYNAENGGVSTNSSTALTNEILDQRRIELWGEGFRFLDLKRQNTSMVRGN